MIKLTARQREILNLIQNAIERTGFPPTRAEIAAELGFRSVNAAEEHLQALARKGVIEMVPGISRGIRLLYQEEKHPETGAYLEFMELPLVGSVAAGAPILAQEHIERKFQVDPAMFPEKPDYLLRVRGTSMKDVGIYEGDYIAVKKTTQVRNNQIIVARIGDEVTVKRFSRKGRSVELLPENSDFEPIKVDGRLENFHIEGLVVGLIRPWG